MYYIIGLGNPGAQYDTTPHNAGRDICFRLIDHWSCTSHHTDKTHQSDVYTCGEYTIVIPNTYMNRSGIALGSFDVPLSDIKGRLIVIHDDIDLPLGSMRITAGQGTAGHRGVESIAQKLGSTEFIRFRIGVSPVGEDGEMRKPSKEKVSDYVLHKLSAGEEARLHSLVSTISKAIACIRDEGIEKAKSLYTTSHTA